MRWMTVILRLPLARRDSFRPLDDPGGIEVYK